MCVEQHGKSGRVSFGKCKVQNQCSWWCISAQAPLAPIYSAEKSWKSGNSTELVLKRTKALIRAVSVQKFLRSLAKTWILFDSKEQLFKMKLPVTLITLVSILANLPPIQMSRFTHSSYSCHSYWFRWNSQKNHSSISVVSAIALIICSCSCPWSGLYWGPISSSSSLSL